MDRFGDLSAPASSIGAGLGGPAWAGGRLFGGFYSVAGRRRSRACGGSGSRRRGSDPLPVSSRIRGRRVATLNSSVFVPKDRDAGAPRSARVSMFPEINSLPRSQRQAAVTNRDKDAGA